ncbi:MAG: hypothetical protein PVJ52_00765 [Candidatus Woesebacteria bacterium]|jgi:hypothetical protein
MAKIVVKKLKDLPQSEFEVVVEDKDTTIHKVSLTGDYYTKLTDNKIPPEKLIRKSFDFLLDREPNTAILSQFELSDISKYFSDYEKEII